MFNTGKIFLTPALVQRRSMVIMLAVTLTFASCAMAQATSAVSNSHTIQVTVTPMNVTVRGGGKHQFTALISGTSNTRVTWSTTAGSIDDKGLYTAPAVTSKTDAVVTAVPDADPKQQVSAMVSVHPANTEGLKITSGPLPQGQQGSVYGEVLAATGGTTPYSWSVSAGTLPAGITLSANGEFTGTPTAAGNYQFTAMVTDAANKAATENLSVNVASSSGYDGPAQLPITTVNSAMADTPAPGQVIVVKAGGDLQLALSNAQCGDTIQLQAGATFTGPFNFPGKNCDNDHWIIVRTSAPDSVLPAEGTRLTPCYAGLASMPNRPAYSCPNPQNVLARLTYSMRNGSGPIVFLQGANHYRLLGLEITRPADKTPVASLVSVAAGMAANNLIIDRSWLHGTAQDETRRGVDLDGVTTFAIVDSYLNDFHCVAVTGTCTDSQAVSGGLGNVPQGTWKIEDNFLEAAAEGILFGGGAATVVPTDITIDLNHFYKVPQWQPGVAGFIGGYNGNPFVVKNDFEIKNGSRVLLDSNLFEYAWGGFSQDGYAIALAPRNDYNKWTKIGNLCSVCEGTDITVRYSRISHVGAGFDIAAVKVDNLGAAGAGRISIHDVVIDDVDAGRFVGSGTLFLVMNGWPSNPLNSISIQHVTGFPDQHVLEIGNEMSNPQMYGFTFSNNLVAAGTYPVLSVGKTNDCSKSDVPVTVVNTCFTTFGFADNVLTASPAHFPPSKWPSQNMFPAAANDVGFVNYNNGNGGNYALLPSSPYKGKASGGTDPGANIDAVTTAIQGIE